MERAPPEEFSRKLQKVRVRMRPFDTTKSSRVEVHNDKELRTTRQIGNYGERIAQEWLFNRFRIRTDPATISCRIVGTFTADLYDWSTAWVYEVKTGRAYLNGRAVGQAYDLRRMTGAGVIKGATFVSVEYMGKGGFSRGLMNRLHQMGLGVLLIGGDDSA